MQHSQPSPDDLRPASWVAAHFGVTLLTIANWQSRPDVGFPAPALRIGRGGKRFWRVRDILAFEAACAAAEPASNAA